MANKFMSFLEHVGSIFKKGLDPVLKVAATAGEVGVQIFAPEFSGLFNQTIMAVMTAEQSAAAIGKQTGSGAQKLAAVVQLMSPLIKQALTDAGRPSDDAEVEKYITSVVTILNAIPVPLSEAVTVTQPALVARTGPESIAAAATAPVASGASISAIQSVLP